jgi:hypothetical protein
MQGFKLFHAVVVLITVISLWFRMPLAMLWILKREKTEQEMLEG